MGNTRNWKIMITVLMGATAGQAVIWYTAQVYVNTWMKGTGVSINGTTADTMVAVALCLGLPFFVIFGALWDRIGCKRVMMAGNLLGALLIYPIFQAIKYFAGPITPLVNAAGKPVLNAGKQVVQAQSPNVVMITLLILLMLALVGMVYGPIAAFLVEAFPAKFATHR